MQLLYVFVLFPLFLLMTSCKPQTSGILVNQKVCSVEECPPLPSKINGSLSIESDSAAYTWNVDQGDIFEISGKCSDLGIKNHIIFTEVYEGENTSEIKYIDNSSSANCEGSSSTLNIGGSLNSKKCFWISQGKGIITDGRVGNTEYPQCVNGRFSFMVRLGRVLRATESAVAVSDDVTNPRKKYLVRFALKSIQDGSQTAWSEALIDRGVSKPNFSLKSDNTNAKCSILTNAARNIENLTDLQYVSTLNRDFAIGTPALPEVIFPTLATPVMNLNYSALSDSSLLNFSIANRDVPINSVAEAIPGVKHKIQIEVVDKKYNYVLNNLRDPTQLERSGLSNSQMCSTVPPILSRTAGNDPPLTTTAGANSCSSSQKFCTFSVTMPPFSLIKGYTDIMIIRGQASWASDYIPPLSVTTILSSSVFLARQNTLPATTGHIFRVAGGIGSFTFSPEHLGGNTCATPSPPQITHSYNATYGVAVRYVDITQTKFGEWSKHTPQNQCSFGN